MLGKITKWCALNRSSDGLAIPQNTSLESLFESPMISVSLATTEEKYNCQVAVYGMLVYTEALCVAVSYNNGYSIFQSRQGIYLLR